MPHPLATILVRPLCVMRGLDPRIHVEPSGNDLWPTRNGVTVTTSIGQTVGSLVSGAISDVDASDAKGIVVTGLTSSRGTWQSSLDGGGTWTAMGSVSGGNALLLRDTDKIRFVPDTLGGLTPTLTYPR